MSHPPETVLPHTTSRQARILLKGKRGRIYFFVSS